MSWLFSRALVEAYSEGISSDGEPCAQLNVMHSPHPFWRNDKPTDASHLSRFGPTSRVLTAEHGEAVLTSFLAAFPVRTSALQEKETDSTARDPDSGASSPGSLARYDPSTHGLKTHQRLLLEEGFESLLTLPAWGMIVAGELYQLPTPSGLMELRSSITSESGSGLPQRAPTPNASDNRPRGTEASTLRRMEIGKQIGLEAWVKHKTPRAPTPTVCGNYNRKGVSKTSGDGLSTWVVKRIPTPTVQDSSNNGAPSQMDRNTKPLNAEVGGPLNPTWVEWLMGWPIGWTDLNAPGTDKFREWCASHGKY